MSITQLEKYEKLNHMFVASGNCCDFYESSSYTGD
jgi:hypothetical protein